MRVEHNRGVRFGPGGWLLLFGALAVGLGVWARPTEAAAATVDSRQKVVTDFLDSFKSLVEDDLQDNATREAKAVEFADMYFDFPYLAGFALGPYARQVRKWELFDKFSEAFKGHQIRQFLRLIVGSGVESFHYDVTMTDDGGGRRIGQVTTEIRVNDGNPFLVKWKVMEKQAHFRIVDVSISGSSILVQSRQKVTSFLRNNGGNVHLLIRSLETL